MCLSMFLEVLHSWSAKERIASEVLIFFVFCLWQCHCIRRIILVHFYYDGHHRKCLVRLLSGARLKRIGLVRIVIWLVRSILWGAIGGLIVGMISRATGVTKQTKDNMHNNTWWIIADYRRFYFRSLFSFNTTVWGYSSFSVGRLGPVDAIVKHRGLHRFADINMLCKLPRWDLKKFFVKVCMSKRLVA